MSAYVLSNLLNVLWERDKMRGLSSFLSLYFNEFNKFNNTGAGMLYTIHQVALKFLLIHNFGVNASIFYHLLRNVIMDVTTLPWLGY